MRMEKENLKYFIQKLLNTISKEEFSHLKHSFSRILIDQENGEVKTIHYGLGDEEKFKSLLPTTLKRFYGARRPETNDENKNVFDLIPSG